MFTETIDLLAERWRAAGSLLPGFGMLAEGKPLPIDQLAAETGHEVDRLRELLVSVRSQFDEEGRLVDLFGMTLEPTPHRLEIGTNVVYSCCALWAHVIPKLIGRSISVRSTDPVGGELVSLSVSPVGIEFLEPVGAAATMAVASAQDIAADVSAAFCHHVNHFASGESAEVFAAESDVRSVVTVDQLNDFGSLFYRKIRSGLEDSLGCRRHKFQVGILAERKEPALAAGSLHRVGEVGGRTTLRPATLASDTDVARQAAETT